MMLLIEEEESARVYFFLKEEGEDVEEDDAMGEQIVSDCPPSLSEIEGRGESLLLSPTIELWGISIHFVSSLGATLSQFCQMFNQEGVFFKTDVVASPSKVCLQLFTSS